MSGSIGKCLGAVCEFEKIITSAVCGSILVAMLWYCRLFTCKDGANMGGGLSPLSSRTLLEAKGKEEEERGEKKKMEEKEGAPRCWGRLRHYLHEACGSRLY
jgi:hypothetical protein